jgi:hypothetical protein
MTILGNKSVKRVFWVVSGGVVTNALNNSLSQVSSNIMKYVLYVLTFGLPLSRDRIYTDIARGYFEMPSLYVLKVLIISLFIVILVALLKDKIKEKKNSKKIIISVSMVVGYLFLLNVIVVSYINMAITHFYQSYQICKPYIAEVRPDADPEKEKERILSRFSGIKSKADYDKLIEELVEIAKKHNSNSENEKDKIELPKFSSW